MTKRKEIRQDKILSKELNSFEKLKNTKSLNKFKSLQEPGNLGKGWKKTLGSTEDLEKTQAVTEDLKGTIGLAEDLKKSKG